MISISNTYFIPSILILSFVFFVFDVETNICFQTNKNLSLYLFLYFHHVLALFLYIGWLSASKTILLFYVFLVLLIIVHWITNDQKCILTQIVNYYCELPDAEGFHDVFYLIGMKQQKWFNTFIYSYLFFALIVSIYKI